MIKKIASAVLVIAIGIFGTVSSQAVNIQDSTVQQELFKALGIAKEMPYSVTYENYVEFLGRMLYDDISLDADTIAKMTGMISGNETLTKNTRIKYKDAVKYSVIALGYKNQAEASGDYFQIAGQLGLTDGIILKPDSGVTGADASILLMNMLDAEPMRGVHNGTGIIYELASDETILSLNRGIVEIEGIVTAGSVTGLTTETGAGKGMIEVDGEVYETDGKFDDLIGKNVVAYVKELTGGEGKLLYMYEYKNKELEIQGENLDSFDGKTLSYFTDDDASKIKKVNVSPVLRVIYNGVFLGVYENEDLLPVNGSIKLIENNKDNEYDVAIVESFETVIVSSVISDKETLVNKFRFDGCIKTISLDIENEDNYVSIYNAEGKAINFTDIKVSDVLSIAESRSKAPRVIKVLKSNRMIEGMISGRDTEGETITVNDVAYEYLDELYTQLETEGKTLSLGKTYKFYLDSFDNIVYAGFINEYDYYIFYRCYEEDEQYFVMYMDTDEMWNTVKLSKNVVVDDVKLTADKAYTKIRYNQPQVAKIYFNTEGDVKEIEFAQLSATADETRFIKSGEKQLMWRTSPKSFSGSVWTEDDTKIFVFPKDVKDREKYSVYDALSYLRSDTTYKFTAYDMDEYGFTPLISINDGDTATIYSQSIFLVTEVYETFVDDEAVSCVNGVFGEFVKYQLTGDSIETFADVKPGDIIKTHTDRKTGRVDGISKVISVDTDEFAKSGPADLYHNDRIITGIVKTTDAARQRILIDCGRDASFRLPSTVPVLIYDRSEKKCETGSVASLTAGDKVVCRVPYIQFAEIIIVRD